MLYAAYREVYLAKLIENGDYEGLAEVLRKDPSIAQKPLSACQGNTLLHLAMRPLRPRIVELLLKVGADPNAMSPMDLTPLHRLAANDADAPDKVCETAKLLLEHGADVNLNGRRGSVLAMLVQSDGPLCFMRFLVENGADLGRKDDDVMTPLEIAESRGFEEVAEYLRSVSGNTSVGIPESSAVEEVSGKE